jgi:hypothetical protein
VSVSPVEGRHNPDQVVVRIDVHRLAPTVSAPAVSTMKVIKAVMVIASRAEL